MDTKVSLIKAFYRGLPVNRAKVEMARYGFDFMKEFLSGGIRLEYGELTLFETLHKFKLTDISESQMDALLRAHVEKKCNVCLYFDPCENPIFCFNLDNNHVTNNTVLIPEIELATASLVKRLGELGCAPLVIASGRGYHVWCRLDAPVANTRLYQFMLTAAAGVLLILHENQLDPLQLKFNFYPDPRIFDVVSLRLFGSKHAKNKVFSRIMTPEGLLDEQASWAYFEDHLKTKTIAMPTFDKAFNTLVAPATPGC